MTQVGKWLDEAAEALRQARMEIADEWPRRADGGPHVAWGKLFKAHELIQEVRELRHQAQPPTEEKR